MKSPIEKLLKTIDLTANESTIYTYLFQYGPQTGRNIVLNTNIDKSSTYKALADLQMKNIVTVLGDNRNQLFSAVEADTILRLLSQKEEELRNARKGIQDFANNISEYKKKSYKALNIKVYEGTTGYIEWMEARLENNIKVIREIFPASFQNAHFENYQEFMENYIAKRVQKNIAIRTLDLRTDPSMFDDFDSTDKKIIKEVRLPQKEIMVNAALTTFGNKCGFYTQQNNSFFGLLIEDHFITTLLNALFDNIWEDSKQI